MRTVGMGINQDKKDDISELKKAFDGLLAENEKLHAKIGVLENELKAALKSKAPKESEEKDKK